MVTHMRARAWLTGWMLPVLVDDANDNDARDDGSFFSVGGADDDVRGSVNKINIYIYVRRCVCVLFLTDTFRRT